MTIQQAFVKIGYKVRAKKPHWPRNKVIRGIRVEVKTGYAMEFVR